MDAATAEFPKIQPQAAIKIRIWDGRICTKAGNATKELDYYSRAVRIVEAIAYLLPGLFSDSHHKHSVKLWDEGVSGIGKCSIYINYKNCPPELKDNKIVGDEIIRNVLEEGRSVSELLKEDGESIGSFKFVLHSVLRSSLCNQLRLAVASSDSEIKIAYRHQVLYIHPDRRPNDEDANEAFCLLNTSYANVNLS